MNKIIISWDNQSVWNEQIKIYIVHCNSIETSVLEHNQAHLERL